jgi:hypothetical protein
LSRAHAATLKKSPLLGLGHHRSGIYPNRERYLF